MSNDQSKEISKLVNVLRRTARMAKSAHWADEDGPEAAAYCAQTFNRIRARLAELEPGFDSVFPPLPEGVSLKIAAMACRQVAAYFEEEQDMDCWEGKFDSENIKQQWKRSASEFQDFGEAIRNTIFSFVNNAPTHPKDCKVSEEEREVNETKADEPEKEKEDKA